jgi:hypothetical protein
MGRVKEMWMEMQERSQDENLAKSLGISYNELAELDWSIEADTSDDGLIYGYRIEFSENSPQSILSKIDGLEDGCRVHVQPWDIKDNYDYEEQFEAITEDKDYVKNYRNEIANLRALCNIKVSEESLVKILNRQVFIGVVGTMETFLLDTFINITFDNETYFENFVKTNPEFKQRKFDLSDIFDESRRLKETAKKVMFDTIYHNLPVVKNMYIDTFKINFPPIKDVYGYVLKRHDLVHRNGKTKNGQYVEIDKHLIQDLIVKVNDLVENIIIELKI